MLRSIPLLKFGFFFFLLTSSFVASATHNRAGEITYRQIGEYTIEATITTYTKASSTGADRDSLEMHWGDGSSEMVLRSNGAGNPPQGVELGNDMKKNLYIATHTYPSQQHYVMSMFDPNRNNGIININNGTSAHVPFYIQTTVTLLSQQFQGYNNSPILLQPPIDIGCVGERFIHNPNAFDIDGDSLAYQLTIPLSDFETDVPNYDKPYQVVSGPNNNFSVNSSTGDIIWDSPQKAGEYNIAILIIEFRNGQPLDTMIRDMQILIKDCDDTPPEIETIDEVCVVAGDYLEFDVIATDADIDPKQKVELTGLGGPFVTKVSPAMFDVPKGLNETPVFGTFKWQTECEHISNEPYSVVFRAVDDQFGDTLGLADLKTVHIKVVGPPPLDVQTETKTNKVTITWEHPYSCDDVADEYFRNFSIWRKENSNPFEADSCETGLDGKGYERIGYTINVENDRYSYEDSDLQGGHTYCYRIVANFAKLSAGGYPFNLVESLPSGESCVQIGKDIPIFTNVDVEKTDIANGEIFVRWTKPNINDLDTIQNPGPYKYELFRAEGINSTNFVPVPGASFESPFFSTANDTFFLDKNINTTLGYNYQLAFYVKGENQPLGKSSTASSILLQISPTDEKNQLTWETEVPWSNFEYVIYRKNEGSNTFDSIGVSLTNNFDDSGLINGKKYCYYVLSKGVFTTDLDLLINKSQEVCSIPIDNVPPCSPELAITNPCDDDSSSDETTFENDLTWTNPNDECGSTDDVVKYNIWYSPIESNPLEIVETVEGAEHIDYSHRAFFGVAGCYAITAIDSVGNESAKSNIVCVDNCPKYILPNTFTPNGDNQNDHFKPMVTRFVDHIEIQIFNRWGGLVFETEETNINWDGKDLQGKDLAEGVYFYTCRVFEKTVQGILPTDNILSGDVMILR